MIKTLYFTSKFKKTTKENAKIIIKRTFNKSGRVKTEKIDYLT